MQPYNNYITFIFHLSKSGKSTQAVVPGTLDAKVLQAQYSRTCEQCNSHHGSSLDVFAGSWPACRGSSGCCCFCCGHGSLASYVDTVYKPIPQMPLEVFNLHVTVSVVRQLHHMHFPPF